MMRKNIMIEIKFEPRDLWIGVYWNVEQDYLNRRSLKIYICIMLMLPIIITLFID